MQAPQLSRTLRTRALASDARAGAWSRNKARREQRRFLRAHWVRLLGAALMMLTTVLAVVAAMPTAFCRGMVLGAGLASVVGVLSYLTLQVTGTAPAMMGGQGEQWTASELRPLQRRGWRVVHHISLRPWDIDHVLIGPGGAYAIETKWSAQPWELDPAEDRIIRAVRQATGNARDLQGWAPFKKARIGVRPVVVLWGPCCRPHPHTVTVDGAVVLHGSGVADWRTSLPDSELVAEQVEAGWQALEAQARVRDEREVEPVPLSVEQALWRTASAVVAAATGVACAAGLLVALGVWWLWIPTCGAAAVLAQPHRQHSRLRLPVLAWQTGMVVVAVLAGLAGLLVAATS